MKLVVPNHQVSTWASGQPLDPLATATDAGDLVLVRHHGAVPSAIRAAERIRKPRGVPRAEWNAYCRVNHACVALTRGPLVLVAQATGAGIVVTPLHEMGAYALAVVHLDMSDDQRAGVVDFAQDSVGTGYGFAQILADLVNAVTGLELSFGWGDRMVCSTASARAQERSSYIPDRSPDCITPAHLAWQFGAVVEAI